jgi:Rps23 Pro-64 3,4-dihydroxylase Tpa1-like proline 4-hydroxylase
MFIKYIENFLTEDECKSIIDLGSSIELIHMKSSQFVNGKLIAENLEYDGNKRMGCYFTDDLLNLPILKILTDKIITLSNQLNPYNGITYNGVSKYSFNRYGVGDFLDWHSDSHEILNGATITYIIQLNNDYEGGDVRYSINDETILVDKKQGSIFIFDSNLSHSVDTITNGLRYSLNVWPASQKKNSLI